MQQAVNAIGSYRTDLQNQLPAPVSSLTELKGVNNLDTALTAQASCALPHAPPLLSKSDSLVPFGALTIDHSGLQSLLEGAAMSRPLWISVQLRGACNICLVSLQAATYVLQQLGANNYSKVRVSAS